MERVGVGRFINSKTIGGALGGVVGGLPGMLLGAGAGTLAGKGLSMVKDKMFGKNKTTGFKIPNFFKSKPKDGSEGTSGGSSIFTSKVIGAALVS